MLCTKCGKNEATVYFSQTINGKKTELHLCGRCADSCGVTAHFDRHRRYIQQKMLTPFGFSGLSLPELSEGLADIFFDHDDLFIPEKQADACPGCGKTAAEIAESGKGGCPMCYEVFPEIFTKKAPAPHPEKASEDKLTQLRAKLEDAIKAERYEDAIKFRDEIKALEQSNL